MKKIFLLVLLLTFVFTCDKAREENSKINDFPFLESDINFIQKGYKESLFSIEEVIRAHLDRIKKIDDNGPEIGAIITINPEAVKIAKELDKELRDGKYRGPLHGIPIVLKDNIDTHDQMETTAGSRALIGSKALKDSYVVKKLREAGAIILGKANLSEWANFRGQNSTSGWSGVNGQTKNPYVLSRNPCGSSSGSAVAVSANLSVLAIGTETNGSIVCPSSANGIVGIKPTVGLISRSGIIPISFTQDTAGPMARSVEDAVICLGVLVGIDQSDSKTLNSKNPLISDYTPYLNKDGLKGKKIALYTAPMGKNRDVDSLTFKAIRLIKSKGAEIIEIDQISPVEASKNSFQVMLYEYKDGLNKYFSSLGKDSPIKNLSELIEFNEKDSIELRYFNQAYLKMANEKEGLNSKSYKEALSSLKRMSQKEGIDRVMDEYGLDAIISPTGSPAWKTDLINGDSYHIGSSSNAAWSGYPNITVPMGDIHGLPVGLSFFGKAWTEPKLIEIAYSFEQESKSRIIPEFKTTD